MKKVLIIELIVIIGLLLTFSLIIRGIKAHNRKDNDKYVKTIVALQQEVKVGEGMYASIVDKYQVKERELLDSLKKKDNLLYKEIKKNKETVLYYETYILSLNTQKDTILIRDTILGMHAFNLKYPLESSFIFYDGLINQKVITGEWRFTDLPITGTITELKDGSWKYYLSGPSWMQFKDIEIKAQSKLDPPKERRLRFPLGVGYQSYFKGEKSLYIMGGIQYKHWQVLIHSSMFEYGFGGTYSF